MDWPEWIDVGSRNPALPGLHTVLWALHLTVEDADGDSAIMEFANGELIVHHGREFTR
jgi:penicillin V acylase-like amidase (Ntn superfamily)